MVYIILLKPGVVKIGYTSRSIKTRMNSLRSEYEHLISLSSFRILKLIYCEKEIEKEYHNYFKKFATSEREVFRFHPEMLTIDFHKRKRFAQSPGRVRSSDVKHDFRYD